MSVKAGTRLGPHEILSAIGAGGMGEVYKARDTRLDRIVAIKVLPTHLADRSELRDRFEREAKTIASLNHPHICTLHDIGHQDEIDYLVMEYLEGETLAQRLVKGALPIQQVLQYAIEIADALDKAHRKGITHRDLKPGNIMLTKSGTKLLDFGLAKLKQEVAPAIPDSQLPTMKSAVTAEGMILGTLQYMAPEQVEAKEVDARTDIFAFGVVVYEMATGKRAFEGKSQSSLIAAILEREPPPMSSLQPMTPLQLDRVVRKCLSKEPEKRWQAASDVCDELKWTAEVGQQTVTAAPHVSRSGRREFLGWAVATIAVIALGLTFLRFRRPAEEGRVLRFPLLTPDRAAANPRSIPAVSPDGLRLAFVATSEGKDGLWVRDLDSMTARLFPGTQGAHHPFWSPDSRSIAFFADGKLKRIDVSGGPALPLCDAQGYGGSWSNRDIIIFAPTSNSPLYRVPAAGGAPTPLTALDQASNEATHRFPWFLPDGRHFLYTAGSFAGSDQQNTAVYVGDIDSQTRKRVVHATSNAVYASPGYLLFLREKTLMAQSFDAERAVTQGDAVAVAEEVENAGGVYLQGQFSASQTGVLVYAPSGGGSEVELTWFDRSGKQLGTVGPPGRLRYPAISPDGRTVAVDSRDPQTGLDDIWLYDVTRGTASRFTFAPPNQFPTWSPDGRFIAYRSAHEGEWNLYQKATNGAPREESLGSPRPDVRPNDWSHDGRYIIEGLYDPRTQFDLWVLPLFGDRKPFPYLRSEFNERYARLSPDGRWLAYLSDETKRDEVYICTFPNPDGGKWQISTNGGNPPVWSRDGKELFFIGADRKLMAVKLNSGAKLEPGVPEALFETRVGQVALSEFDISKDGHFLVPTLTAVPSADGSMNVVLNWAAGLKK
jgi:Tol biopolymer transport system component